VTTSPAARSRSGGDRRRRRLDKLPDKVPPQVAAADKVADKDLDKGWVVVGAAASTGLAAGWNTQAHDDHARGRALGAGLAGCPLSRSRRRRGAAAAGRTGVRGERPRSRERRRGDHH
jgi:hypothetical protein